MSPAIGADGTIYIGSGSNNFFAINPDGTEKWRYAAAGAVMSSAAIGGDDSIFFGNFDWYLYSLDRDGYLRWKFQTFGARFLTLH